MRPGLARGPAWMTLALTGAAGFLLGVVLLVAVRGIVHDQVRTVTRTVSSAPAELLIPDVTGAQLDQAQQTLEDAGLDVQVDGGGLFGVVDPTNWRVSRQDPGAGAPLRPGTTIRLSIERR